MNRAGKSENPVARRPVLEKICPKCPPPCTTTPPGHQAGRRPAVHDDPPRTRPLPASPHGDGSRGRRDRLLSKTDELKSRMTSPPGHGIVPSPGRCRDRSVPEPTRHWHPARKTAESKSRTTTPPGQKHSYPPLTTALISAKKMAISSRPFLPTSGATPGKKLPKATIRPGTKSTGGNSPLDPSAPSTREKRLPRHRIAQRSEDTNL